MRYFGRTGELTNFLTGQRDKMRRRRARRNCRLTAVETLEARQVLAAIPVISEVLASNDRGINDEDGEDADWIELHNAGEDSMSLDRWYLTDDANDLRKWRFPDTMLESGGHLLVFATGKDRNVAGSELHTNFKIDSDGEYLALVEPDGQTIAFEFAPTLPPQVTDVSYGISTGTEYRRLISKGAPARVLIPTDGSLDQVQPEVVQGTWLDPALNDQQGGWFSGTTGLGFVPSQDPVVLADSVAEFSGVQGQANWSYGWWTLTGDADGKYAPTEFQPFANTQFDAANNKWDLAVNSSPYTELSAQGGHPTAGGFLTQWAIRRWTSETTGEVTLTGTLANPDANGDGVIGRILVNGVEAYQQAVDGQSQTFNVKVNVSVGDVIDFAIDAGAAGNDVGDLTTFTAQVIGVPLVTVPVVPAANSSTDWTRTSQQGANGWYFGYYEASADGDQTYQSSDFSPFADNVWSDVRRRWDWPDASVDTEITQGNVTPHSADGLVHWVIRRWESTVGGNVQVDVNASKSSLTGDGTTVYVIHNGVEIDRIELAANNNQGENNRYVLQDVRPGDALDFIVAPHGPGVDPTQATSDGDRTNITIDISRLADLEPSISTDLSAAMRGISSSAYVRIPFQVDDLQDLDILTLSVQYDDAFVAYINGQVVASGNAPDQYAFNSVAATERPVEDATVFESFDLSSKRGLFVQGQNLLQVHVMNSAIDDDDLLVLPELVVGTQRARIDQTRYFTSPTPGESNGLGTTTVGPLVRDVDHSPNVPSVTDPIVVTAEVARTFADVQSVQLTYVVMYEAAAAPLTMVDNGTNGDATAGDGIYTAVIPAGVAQPGQMIRWYVTASDVNQKAGRFPAYADPSTDEEYRGTIVADPTVDTNLPFIHWFSPSGHRRATTDAGERGSLFYDGEFYDNVFMALHGQSSRGFATNKKSLNVDMPNDHRFKWQDGLQRMEDFNLLSNFADKSKVRNTLTYDQHIAAGTGYHLASPVRVHLNGEFFAVYDFVEDPDWRWLERLDLDKDGTLYKMYNTFGSPAGNEKKAGPDGTQDLADFMTGLRNNRGDALAAYIMDNVNVPAMANFLASYMITSNRDCCHKNYYAYYDVNETGNWWFLPWDVDLTQGRVWSSGPTYYDDTMFIDTALYIASNNELVRRLYDNTPGFKEMYLRRVRTLMDELVQPPGTPSDQLVLENRVKELYEWIGKDGDEDNAKNPARWGQTGEQTFEEAVQILLNEYAGPRRQWLYGTQTVPDESGLGDILVSGNPGDTMAKYFVPTNDSLGLTWTQIGFNDSAWASGPTGIGFQSATPQYADLIKTDIGAQMLGVSPSAYVRIPFQVDDPSALESLTLRLKVDDGYVAYLNGTEVGRARLRSANPTWDTISTTNGTTSALRFENIVIGQASSLLQAGTNVLAIQVVNSSATNNDLLLLPELTEGVIFGSTGGQIPMAQVGNPKVDIGRIEFNPSSRNQDEEFVALVNNNNFAVDISRWKLAGDIDMTFEPGTVIPAGYTLYAAANVKAFRTRTEGPTGGQGLFVMGNYDDRLPNLGGVVQLVADDGQLVAEKSYTGQSNDIVDFLRISEVHYNPQQANAAELAADNSLISEDFEFIELVNTSTTRTLDLNGVRLSDGVEFDFTTSAIKQLVPGQRTLIVSNLDGFRQRYGLGLLGQVAGEFANNTALRDNGERLTLLDSGSTIIQSFVYSDDTNQGWSGRADGAGSSLQIVDPRGNASEPRNWRPSAEIGGSPGVEGVAAIEGLVINEVLARSTGQQTDQIELFNPTTRTVSVVNYYLSDAAGTSDELLKYRFTAGSVAPGAYLVLNETQFNAGGGNNAGFALSATNGEELFLTVGDGTKATHFVDFVTFGGSADGETFGRWPNAAAGLAPMSPSLGRANLSPRVGPLVMSEIQYQPGEPSSQAKSLYPSITSDDLEFIEIHNPTGQTVSLREWRLRGGVDIDFDDNLAIGAGKTLVILPFNPANPANALRLAAFRAHYGIGGDLVTFVGGYSGQLSDGGETVRLLRPEFSVENPEQITRLLEDVVFFDEAAPWPTTVHGTGLSLNRTDVAVYGDDPTHWVAAVASPGTAGGSSSADLNGDGIVDVQDIERLCQAMDAGDLQFDLNGDGTLDSSDVAELVINRMGTYIGDANLDGVFNSSDFVRVFLAGEYEDSVPGNSTWSEGDWNCDGEFNSGDFVMAFLYGGYSNAVAPVAVATDAALSSIGAALVDETALPEDEANGQTTRGLRADEVTTKRLLLDDVRPYDDLFSDRELSFERWLDDSDELAELLAGPDPMSDLT